MNMWIEHVEHVDRTCEAELWKLLWKLSVAWGSVWEPIYNNLHRHSLTH